MAEKKYLQITSLSDEDINALFNAIADLNKVSPIEMKRVVLEMTKDNEAFLTKYKPTILDLIKVINFYDYPVKLRIEYLDYEAKSQSEEDSKKKYDSLPQGVKPKDTAFLERQMEEVSPELLEGKKVVINEVPIFSEVKEVKIDPNDIPEFN